MERLVDHHAHLFSPKAAQRLSTQIGRVLPPFTASDLVAVLDADHVATAVVLSVAYLRSDDTRPSEVADENDWMADQIERHAGRLVGFFSVNPLFGAEEEVDRCARSGRFVGLKVHLANSGVDLLKAQHQERLAMVLASAAERRLPVVIHLRTSRDWGATHAEAFIESVLPAARETPVQIAHLAGWGGYDDETDAALGAFARRATHGELDHVYFDVSAVVRGTRRSRADYEPMLRQLHHIGFERILFGTDWPDWTPRAYLADLEAAGVRAADLKEIARNRAPWLPGDAAGGR